MRQLLAIGLLLASSSSFAFSSQGFYGKKIPGFYLGHFDGIGLLAGCRDYDRRLYRGGRPDLAGKAWVQLIKKEGIDYILDLRSEATRSSEEAAIREGLGYIHIPLVTGGRVQPAKMTIKVRHLGQSTLVREMDPVDATISILQLVDQLSAKGHRIYIHCARGEDRTGTIVSLLRKCNNARAEFRRYGGSDYASLTWLKSRVEARSTEY
jgi:hypothetical protein